MSAQWEKCRNTRTHACTRKKGVSGGAVCKGRGGRALKVDLPNERESMLIDQVELVLTRVTRTCTSPTHSPRTKSSEGAIANSCSFGGCIFGARRIFQTTRRVSAFVHLHGQNVCESTSLFIFAEYADTQQQRRNAFSQNRETRHHSCRSRGRCTSFLRSGCDLRLVGTRH